MNTASSPTLAGSAPAATSGNLVKKIGLIVALAALFAIVLMPAPLGLPQAGQVMLGILAFAVIVWMTEALDYAVSSVVIGALMIFLLAYAPDVAKPAGADMGTGAALGLALSGFANSAVALVAAACFIAAAMTATGLDRRIALVVLSKVDARTNHIVMGAMIVGFLLSFIVPSTTARVACLVPIMMGFILAFKVEKRSRFAGLLVITAAQTASVWNIGIKTAAAQNMVAIGFMGAAHTMGVAIPGDISVVGIDNIPFGRFTSPALTTVDTQSERLGEEGMRLLLREIEQGIAPGAGHVKIEPRLVVRDSTRVREAPPATPQPRARKRSAAR